MFVDAIRSCILCLKIWSGPEFSTLAVLKGYLLMITQIAVPYAQHWEQVSEDTMMLSTQTYQRCENEIIVKSKIGMRALHAGIDT